MSLIAIRRGVTGWNPNGMHTGTTALPLAEHGRRLAGRLRPDLGGRTFAPVLVSPMFCARETSELTGFSTRAIVDSDLLEWNHRKYDGLMSMQIHEQAPDWFISQNSCPGAGTPEQVRVPADRVIDRGRASGGSVALFDHEHLPRVLAARWSGMPAGSGPLFALNTGILNVPDDGRGIPARKSRNAPLGGDVPTIARQRSRA